MRAVPDPQLEAECIRRILAGERHLFHELIRPCERAIYFLLLLLLRNETEAEDAAQERAIKVYLNLHNFRGTPSFGPGCSRLRAMRAWGDCAKWQPAAKTRSKQGLTNRQATTLRLF